VPTAREKKSGFSPCEKRRQELKPIFLLPLFGTAEQAAEKVDFDLF